jgi:glutamate racemase
LNAPSKLPIGIFDSGVGGLTVVREIHRLLPGEDLIYLGDTARVPYGSKSPGTVLRFAREDTAFLIQQRVKAVVVACNTVSAWALPALEQEFTLPIYGVVLPGAKAALESTRNGRIGIIGTKATIRSQAYRRTILAHSESALVFARACPLLVPLVEEGWTHHRVTRTVLREYLRPLVKQEIDTLVLGCTHYPLLKWMIGQVAGPGIRLVDSAVSCATHVRVCLQEKGLLKPSSRGTHGVIRPFVTDEAEHFSGFAERFLGLPSEEPQKVVLPNLA